MKILKYIVLGLFLLNLPGVVLVSLGTTLGSALSYLSFLLLIFYYLNTGQGKPNAWLFYIGILYFAISGFQVYTGDFRGILILLVKYLIVIICANEFYRKITIKEITYCLLIGAITIIFQAVFLSNLYGRYSGFYLNPNAAGQICLFGLALTYGIKEKKLRQILQILFTIAGLVTFSRTFIILWVLLNIISIKINIKNAKTLVIGFFMFLGILTYGELFNLKGLRFRQFQAFLNSDASVSQVGGESRSETWSRFYEHIYEYPIFGGGFGKFQGGGVELVGPHNTYLLIIGEAGIFPLLLTLIFFGLLLYEAYKVFPTKPYLLMMVLISVIYLFTSHTLFTSYIKLSIIIFIHQHLRAERKHSLL